MRPSDQSVPGQPCQRTAAGTHPLELQRLALQEQTHPDCRPLSVQALIWLFRGYSAAVSAQADELRPLGLSPSAFNVLMALRNTPGRTLEPCQLSERLLVSRPSITGLLDTLEGKGLVTRRPHEHDRRRVIVSLTPAGNALLERHLPAHYAELNALFEELSDDDLATLVSLLRRLRGAIPPSLADP
ncbi:MAG TPA: MarR family transcriptional regulator [Egibacteraceae bacterium]|nr:MarR family transcriptional regulator [Egibacteraceae bacterium]